jgi:anaerobic magnesium-protoporphyrin IX monomethyl ester cyclase
MTDSALRVLLVRPPYTRLRGTGQAPYFPLGIGYLSALANEAPGIIAKVYYAENPSPIEKNYIIGKQGVFAYRSQAHKNLAAAVENSIHPA